MNNYKIGLLGNFWRMQGFFPYVEFVCFLYCVIKRIVDRAPDVTFNKNVCGCGFRQRESNLFLLSVFSKSVVLRTKERFKKNEVIALWVQYTCHLGLIDETSHLPSPIGSPLKSFFGNFRLDCVGSGTLSNVHHSSMLLVINMGANGGHMSYAHAPQNKRNCCVIMYIHEHTDQLQ